QLVLSFLGQRRAEQLRLVLVQALDDLVASRPLDLEEEGRRAGLDLVAQALDELVVDAVVAERTHKGAGCCADSQAGNRNEEDQPEEHAPERATRRAGARRADRLLDV